MTLRVGMLGCGMIAPYHLRGWLRIPEVEVVALADADPARAEAMRRELAPGARVHDGLSAMLESESLDVVDILTPPAQHVEHCLTAARAGVHIICQKPLASRLGDAEGLVAAMADYPRAFVVHENHRFRPWFQDLLAQRDDGILGRIGFLRLEQHDARAPLESFKVQSDRGVLLEYGVHMIDMVRALLGEPLAVTARTDRLNPRVAGDSFAHVTFEYPRATAVVEISWRANGADRGSALVLGDAGEASWEGRLTRGDGGRYRVVQGTTIVRDERRSPTAEYCEAFYLFERAFVDALRSGTPLPQAAADNLRTLRLAFAAYDAAAGACRIELDTDPHPADTPCAH
jgi:predicted dehydrogenase